MKKQKRQFWKVFFNLLFIFGVSALLCACAETTYQTRSTKTSGFLEDYSQFKKGGDGEALLVYIDSDTDFKKYDKILFDPVQVYVEPDSKIAKLKKEDLQIIISYLDAAVREQMKSDYTFVAEPGPDVMRLRVAITEAKGSAMVLDTLSSVLPPAIILSGLTKVITGKASAVGSARVEAELVDSLTGKRLAAGVDERAGKKYTGKGDKWNKWQDVKDAYDYWAKRLKKRLDELCGR